MFRISDMITDATSAYKVQKERLDKICEMFRNKELVNNLEGTEKSAYINYILPVIEGNKKFDDLSGVFFSALLANYDADEYQINTIKNEDRNTIDSDDWIENLNKNIEKAIKALENLQFKEYQQQEDKELKAAHGIKDKLLANRKIAQIQEKYKDRAQWYDTWIKEKEYFSSELVNILSVCARLDFIYYQSQFKNEYEAKMEHILRETKCLPIDIKRRFLDKSRKNIDILYDAISETVKEIYDDVEKAKARKNDKELVDAMQAKWEYEMLKDCIDD